MELDESIAPAMGRLVTQLIEQGLGSKQVGFNPRVGVASYGHLAGFEVVALPIHPETSADVKMMLTMSTLSAFVAIVAYHRKIKFVTHPEVKLYKRRAMELTVAAEVEQKGSNPGSIITALMAYLSDHPQTHFVEVLCYGHVFASHQQIIKDWLASNLASRTPSTSIAVVPDEAWNHSSYQSAVQTEGTVYVVVVFEKYCSQVKGVSKGAVYGNSKTLLAIALATNETLLPKALYFRVGERFLEEQVSLDAAWIQYECVFRVERHIRAHISCMLARPENVGQPARILLCCMALPLYRSSNTSDRYSGNALMCSTTAAPCRCKRYQKASVLPPNRFRAWL